MTFRTLDGVAVAGKRVLLRADLNVPVRDGKITDLTRIERLSPTIRELSEKGAHVIVLSHFDRPKGKRVPEMSLAPMATALGQVLGRKVRFAEDCIGSRRSRRSIALQDGDVAVLENTRFHPGEEKNDPAFAARTGQARRHLRQRRVLRRPPRPRQHRGHRPSAAELCRPADAGGAGGAGGGADHAGAPGHGDRRRRQGRPPSSICSATSSPRSTCW